jgi:hypothetical protein
MLGLICTKTVALCNCKEGRGEGERKRERKREPAFELVNQGEHETTKHTNQVASNTCATPEKCPNAFKVTYVSSPEFSIGDLVLLDGSERISLYPYTL